MRVIAISRLYQGRYQRGIKAESKGVLGVSALRAPAPTARPNRPNKPRRIDEEQRAAVSALAGGLCLRRGRRWPRGRSAAAKSKHPPRCGRAARRRLRLVSTVQPSGRVQGQREEVAATPRTGSKNSTGRAKDAAAATAVASLNALQKPRPLSPTCLPARGGRRKISPAASRTTPSPVSDTRERGVVTVPIQATRIRLAAGRWMRCIKFLKFLCCQCQ